MWWLTLVVTNHKSRLVAHPYPPEGKVAAAAKEAAAAAKAAAEAATEAAAEAQRLARQAEADAAMSIPPPTSKVWWCKVDPGLKALGCQPVESTFLSKLWFQTSTCTPPAWVRRVQTDESMRMVGMCNRL